MSKDIVQQLQFEEIKTNLADTLWRASIPGGWLVEVTSSVAHLTESRGIQEGFDWRTSITFVPDPLHTWNLDADPLHITEFHSKSLIDTVTQHGTEV